MVLSLALGACMGVESRDPEDIMHTEAPSFGVTRLRTGENIRFLSVN